MSPDRHEFHTQLEERADERPCREAFIAVCTISLSYYKHEGCNVACPSRPTAIQKGPCFVHCQRETLLTGLRPHSVLTR